jgi:hypothetical protein
MKSLGRGLSSQSGHGKPGRNSVSSAARYTESKPTLQVLGSLGAYPTRSLHQILRRQRGGVQLFSIGLSRTRPSFGFFPLGAPDSEFGRILDAERVLVMAVAHGRRRPGYWQRRDVNLRDGEEVLRRLELDLG